MPSSYKTSFMKTQSCYLIMLSLHANMITYCLMQKMKLLLNHVKLIPLICVLHQLLETNVADGLIHSFRINEHKSNGSSNLLYLSSHELRQTPLVTPPCLANSNQRFQHPSLGWCISKSWMDPCSSLSPLSLSKKEQKNVMSLIMLLRHKSGLAYGWHNVLFFN